MQFMRRKVCCKLNKKVAVLKEIRDLVANTLFELQKRYKILKKMQRMVL